MRISSAAVQFSAQHDAMSRVTQEESLRIWIDSPARDEVVLSPEAEMNPPSETAPIMDQEEQDLTDPKLALLKLLVEKFIGHSIRILSSHDLARLHGHELGNQKDVLQSGEEQPQRAGYGVAYDRRELYEETETTNFSAQVQIQTADGKSIDARIELTMARSYQSENTLQIRLGDARAIDPLVINFSGQAAQLGDQTFAFDLDADGQDEILHTLAPGSGFLVLDKNHDNVINDGSELFGPQNGSGLQALSDFDEDHNGWIDEADAVYHQLRISTLPGDPSVPLATLAEKQIGAIYLGGATTSFQLNDANNNTLGHITHTGIYVREDGGLGTIQELDLMASNPAPPSMDLQI